MEHSLLCVFCHCPGTYDIFSYVLPTICHTQIFLQDFHLYFANTASGSLIFFFNFCFCHFFLLDLLYSMENPNNIVDFDYCLIKQHIALFVLNSLLLINNIIGNYYYYVGKTNST